MFYFSVTKKVWSKTDQLQIMFLDYLCSETLAESSTYAICQGAYYAGHAIEKVVDFAQNGHSFRVWIMLHY